MKHLRSYRAHLALLLAVVACGGPSTAVTTTHSATPGPAATLTQPPATATETPTATTAPSATAASTATATTPPSATPDPLHTACDHPYWPLRVGATWVSKSGEVVFTSTVTAVTGDLEEAEATYEVRYSTGSIQTTQLFCDKDGIAYGDSNSRFPDGRTGTKKIVSKTGQSLIAPDKLVDGAEWDWSQTADYSTPVYDNGVFTRQSDYQNVASQSCTVTGPQTVTVTVGTFQAFHADCTGTNVSTAPNTPSATYPFNSQLDYALGVGLVSNNLISYTIP
jgi:hypothetical protein